LIKRGDRKVPKKQSSETEEMKYQTLAWTLSCCSGIVRSVCGFIPHYISEDRLLRKQNVVAVVKHSVLKEKNETPLPSVDVGWWLDENDMITISYVQTYIRVSDWSLVNPVLAVSSNSSRVPLPFSLICTYVWSDY
jgi:hypothetical protein